MSTEESGTMPAPMNPAQRLPENQGVLRYLGQGELPERVPVTRPPSDVDTFRLGAHPDIVEWLWSTLNAALPADASYLVRGGAALVQPETGRILAVAIGTEYAILVTGSGLAAAQEAGYPTTHTFSSVGRTLDLAVQFGPGWYFGSFERREGEWLAETYRAPNL
jgi:hypothetical protein